MNSTIQMNESTTHDTAGTCRSNAESRRAQGDLAKRAHFRGTSSGGMWCQPASSSLEQHNDGSTSTHVVRLEQRCRLKPTAHQGRCNSKRQFLLRNAKSVHSHRTPVLVPYPASPVKPRHKNCNSWEHRRRRQEKQQPGLALASSSARPPNALSSLRILHNFSSVRARYRLLGWYPRQMICVALLNGACN